MCQHTEACNFLARMQSFIMIMKRKSLASGHSGSHLPVAHGHRHWWLTACSGRDFQPRQARHHTACALHVKTVQCAGATPFGPYSTATALSTMTVDIAARHVAASDLHSCLSAVAAAEARLHSFVRRHVALPFEDTTVLLTSFDEAVLCAPPPSLGACSCCLVDPATFRVATSARCHA